MLISLDHGNFKQRDSYHKKRFYTIRDLNSQFIPEGLLKLMTPT